MNKIVISNKGLIIPEDLMLIGSSSKRGDSSKIGMFGSGWKYALAWFLRNGVKIEIYSGHNQIEISTIDKSHRSNNVKVITVDGEKTSLTTDMGPGWSGWMALREVVSNAIDEGEHSVDFKWNPEVNTEANKTKIVIPVNNELSDIMMKYEHYFAFDRETSYNYEAGRVFLKSSKSEINIYRKGIRCYDDSAFKDSYIDFDFNKIPINESRISSYWDVENNARKIMKSPDIHLEVFVAALNSGNMDFLPTDPTERILEHLECLYQSDHSFYCQGVLNIKGLMAMGENGLEVPDSWWKILEDKGWVESMFSFLGSGYKFMRTDAFETEGIKYYLKGIRCNIEVQVGKFDSSFIDVKVEGNKALVSEKIKGRDRYAAAKIIKKMDVMDIEELLA